MSEVDTVEAVESVKRGDIAKTVAELYEVSTALADKMVMTIFEEIAEAVSLGKVVGIPGFGKFKPVVRAARTGRNPKTGEAISVPEKAAIKFSAAHALKKTIAA